MLSGAGLALCCLLLSACGSSGNREAVDACKAEVMGKIQGDMGEIDEKDMLANSSQLEDGNIEVKSVVTYRRGTAQESTQTFNCVVAADESGRYSRVIRMSIDW